jgi:hypothetical protein
VHFLNTPIQFRKLNDVIDIERYTRKIPLFQESIKEGSNDVHRQCCFNMKHEFFRKGKKVFD